MKPFLTWFPRILILCYAAFISVFAADAFSEEGTIVHQIVDFMLHLVPTAITLILLWVAWQNRMLGGLLFVIWGMVFTVYFSMHRTIPLFLTFSLPLLLSGFVFIFSQLYVVKKA